MKKTILVLTLALLLSLCVLVFASCANTPDTGVASEIAQNYTPETVVDMPTKDSSDINTEMKESEKYVNVSFDSCGGTGTIQTYRVKYNSTVTLPSGGFEKQGFRLTGWSTSPNASAQYSLNGLFTVYDYDVSLYASYVENTTTIYFSKQNEDIYGESVSVVVDRGTTYTLPASYFSCEGMEFLGWSRNSMAKTADLFPGDDLFVTGDTIELFPVFSPLEYRLIYSDVTPSGEDRTITTVKYGEEVALTCDFAREGHTLVGFATEKNSTDVVYNIGDTISIKKDVVVYCVWEANPVSITFCSSDENFVMERITGRYGDRIQLPVCEYVPKYHEFSGWSIEGENSNYIKFADQAEMQLVCDLTLYPVYSIIDRVGFYLTESQKITDEGSLYRIKCSERVNMAELQRLQYTSYRVLINFSTQSISGGCKPKVSLYSNTPKDNLFFYNFDAGRPATYSDKYCILSESFSVGDSKTYTTTYRDIDEVLNSDLYIFFQARPKNSFDLVKNHFRLLSVEVWIEFYR